MNAADRQALVANDSNTARLANFYRRGKGRASLVRSVSLR
jgi:hypothetical protein